MIEPRIATGSQTIGPFFHFALTARPNGRLIDRFPEGEPVRLRISVKDGDGQPVDDAMVELSQASVFGRLPTSPQGECEFETVRPPAGSRTASYISVCLFARGLLRHLHTRIYFQGDERLTSDPVMALIPEDRRTTLVARREAGESAVWRFDIRLQGEGETVFFDM
jgi:protocatechuate 3,4-dioxygenase alpha subunit